MRDVISQMKLFTNHVSRETFTLYAPTGTCAHWALERPQGGTRPGTPAVAPMIHVLHCGSRLAYEVEILRAHTGDQIPATSAFPRLNVSRETFGVASGFLWTPVPGPCP